MTNRSYTSLYTGVTGDLLHRVWKHKFQPSGFAKRYRTTLLVYCDETDNINDAIAWEKRIKNMHRPDKITLIESRNPSWHDLAANWYDDLYTDSPKLATSRERPLLSARSCWHRMTACGWDTTSPSAVH